MYKSIAYRTGILVAVTLAIIWAITGTAANSKDKSATAATQTSLRVQTADDSLFSRADSAGMHETLAHRVVAYYFHGNVRCVSCRKIEAYTKEAIDSAFGDALKSGVLEWKVVNTDSAKNDHFLQDYQLYTKSVVLSDLHNDKETRWKNLEKVWELLGDQAKFHLYIQDEVRTFLDSSK